MVYVEQQQHGVKKTTRATRTLVPDSLPMVFAFLEALSSLVDMIQGHYDSRCGGPGYVCCAGYTL